MPRYKILIEYDGTNYSGWQKQPNANTVEEEIEKGLAQILRQPIDIIGQGRTDAGVHAEGQVAHFDFDKPLKKEKLLFGLLGVLPKDIAVWDMEEVPEEFHARFYGKTRQYRYQIITRPSPIHDRYAEMVLGDLDTDAMAKCAAMILGTHNFESFTYSSEEQPSTDCEVFVSEFQFDDPLIRYRIKANRFVRHMVRRLVGTMVQVGLGKRSVEHFADLLNNPSKDKSGHGASAKGLILENVEY
ncbi:MAG: tRNA pseudouridine(38-40) synthase TruA [Balneolaceae bacterium]|nr:tRNA pseudouridine(38-40) synthase TruA [Balneolaceae bacterium]